MGASHILNSMNGTKSRKTAKWYHISTSSHHNLVSLDRRNSPEVFLVKVVLKYAANLHENNHAEV